MRTASRPNQSALNVELLTETVDGSVVSESMRWTDLRFRVTNPGTETQHKLELEAGCNFVEPIPDTLAPNASFVTTIRVKAPPHGKAMFRVPLYAPRERRPLAWLAAAVEVPIHPPFLATPLHDLKIAAIEGDPALPALRLATLEQSDESAWITGLHCETPEMAEIRLLETSQLPDYDPRYCRRFYTFAISPRAPDLGTVTGTISLDVRTELAEAPAPVTCRIERLARIAVHPGDVERRDGMDRVWISVVDRLGLEEPKLRVEAPGTARVQRLDGRVALFEVRRDVAMGSKETPLIVECGDVALASVVIGWEATR
jgi:hypothetical protein